MLKFYYQVRYQYDGALRYVLPTIVHIAEITH
jgi:hypothetical protein